MNEFNQESLVKNTNKGLIIALIIISVIAILSIGYICYDNFFNNKDEQSANTDDDKDTITSELLVEKKWGVDATATATINKIEYAIKVKDDSITINGDSFYNVEAPKAIDKIYRLGDLFAIFTGSGDLIGNTITFIDTNKNVVKTIDYWDEGPFKMSIIGDEGTLTYPGMEISNGEMTIMATSFANGAFNLKDGKYLQYPISNSDMTKYGITNNTIVSGTYKINYLGNNKFSTLTLIDEKTYSEFSQEMQEAGY